MRKVMVIGCPGSGKSVFSRELHRVTGLPLYHLDNLYWNADGTHVEKAVFLERLLGILAEDVWIVDGNYNSTMLLRLEVCDTVVFLDYPLSVCLDGIRSRRGQVRSDIPWIEPADAVDAEFLAFVEGFAENSRPRILQLLARHPDKTVYHFHSRDEAQRCIQRLEEKQNERIAYPERDP